MNYNAFTKAELIEAIKSSGDGSYCIDNYLINLWNKKTKDCIEEGRKLSEKFCNALKIGDLKSAVKIKKEIDENDKKYEKLNKMLD
ncbi:MAG: hypothetical protein Q4D26_09790 [Clostridia bacterium]|nr:hypothetical protein [Clostridia bacterium]